jgi:hypothetical protein
MNMIPPSNPGYAFNIADVARAGVSMESLGRLILAEAARNPGGQPSLEALLAAILKTQARANCRYQPVAFDYTTFDYQQVLTENPLRSYLMVQNVGANDLLIVFESGPVTVQDFSAASAQDYLTNMQTRALRVVAGGYFEPLKPPTNPISLFTLNGATNGVLIEGA